MMVVREGKETLTGKRPRSPTDHKSICEKENKRPDKEKPRIKSKLRSLLATNNKNDMMSSVMSGSDVDLDMRSPSPSTHDVTGSPTASAPKLPSKLKHVLLYENTMEQRLLDQQIRKIDSQQNRGAIAIATDIARVRESSARLKQSARALRINSADANGAVRSSLPPIITDLNHHFSYGEPPTVQSPTEIIRQRALRHKARSAGTFLPKISKDEAKPEPKGKTNKRNDISLPNLIASKYGLSSRLQNPQDDASATRPKHLSHSAITRRSVDDHRFKQLQERLLDMSSVLALEKRLRPWVQSNLEKKNKVDKYDIRDDNENDTDDEESANGFDDENNEYVYDSDARDSERRHLNTPVNNFKCNDLVINEL